MLVRENGSRGAVLSSITSTVDKNILPTVDYLRESRRNCLRKLPEESC